MDGHVNMLGPVSTNNLDSSNVCKLEIAMYAVPEMFHGSWMLCRMYVGSTVMEKSSDLQ